MIQITCTTHTHTHTHTTLLSWLALNTYVYRTYFVPMSICVGMTMVAVCWWNDSFLVKEERRRRRLLIQYSTQSNLIGFDSIQFCVRVFIIVWWINYIIHHFIHVDFSNLSSFYSVGHIISYIRYVVTWLRGYVTLRCIHFCSFYYYFLFMIHFLIL